ncbi:MAG: hypothetical protein B7Z45_05255, partial [Azorhizobium sp. 12-66-6]
GWGLFAIADLVDRQLTYHDPLAALVLTVLSTGLLVLLSLGLHSLYRRPRFTDGLTPRTLARVGLLSVGAAVSLVSVLSLARLATGWDIPAWQPLEEFLIPLTHYTLVFLGWSLAYLWLRSELKGRLQAERAARAEAEALRAELQQLRLQLDPHFLFNALNGVAEELHESPQTALAMLGELSVYLRHSLAGIDHPLVTVAAEATALRAFLRIQEARFGPRLAATLSVAEDARDRDIASFLLQPLVENAIKHGDRSSRLRILIAITTAPGRLDVRVENTGHLMLAAEPMPDEVARGTGVGLANLRRRLALHYPDRHSFTLAQGAPGADGPVVRAHLVLEGDPCSGS